MKAKRDTKTLSFREQMADSMAELQGMIERGESPGGNGRLTVRRIRVSEPGGMTPRRSGRPVRD